MKVPLLDVIAVVNEYPVAPAFTIAYCPGVPIEAVPVPPLPTARGLVNPKLAAAVPPSKVIPDTVRSVTERLVPVATPIFGVTKVGLVARTLLPVPVFVTLTKFFEPSVAMAEEAVKPDRFKDVDETRPETVSGESRVDAVEALFDIVKVFAPPTNPRDREFVADPVPL